MQIIVAPADIIVNTSQSVSVMCVANGLPLPRIVWLRNGILITNSSMHTSRERYEDRAGVGPIVVGTLEICPSAAGGEYTCRAQSMYSSMDASFAVNTPGMQTLATIHHT